MSSIFFPPEANHLILSIYIYMPKELNWEITSPPQKKKKNSVGGQENKLALKLDLATCSPLCHTPILKVLP